MCDLFICGCNTKNAHYFRFGPYVSRIHLYETKPYVHICYQVADIQQATEDVVRNDKMKLGMDSTNPQKIVREYDQ